MGWLDRIGKIFVRGREEEKPAPAPSPPPRKAEQEKPATPADEAKAGAPAGEHREPGIVAHALSEFFRIRGSLGRTQGIVLGIFPIVVILGLWWLATFGSAPEERWISPVILPSPGEVVRSLPSLWFDRALARSVVTSLGRVLGGFCLAAIVAIPLGIAMGAFTKVKALMNPIAVMGSYLPIAAIVPLTISWFGTGEEQKAAFLAIASFVVLLPLVVKAIDAVDSVYLNTAYTLGANRLQAVFKVLVGVALPDIVDALRLTFGVGWTYIILAEIVAAERGLGMLIITSQRRGPREHIYLVLVVIVGLAFVIDQLFLFIARALFPYRGVRR